MPEESKETKEKTPKKGQSKVDAKKVFSWYQEARDKSASWRQQAAVDCGYYDNEQWTTEEKDALAARGQAAIVINRIKPTIDLVLGTETRSKVEFKAAPRTEQHVKDAEIITETMKHGMDANQAEFLCSSAFENQVKAGWGFLELSKNDNPFGDPVKISFVPRCDLLWDPYAKEYDLQDAKYIIRRKWMDLEEAIALFPEHEDVLRQAVTDEQQEVGKIQPYQGTEDQPDRVGVISWDNPEIGSTDWLDTERQRVMLIECWYKVPAEIFVISNEVTGDVDEFDPQKHLDDLMMPGSKVFKARTRKVRLQITAGPNTLDDSQSQYQTGGNGGQLYPFIPFWGYRTDKDGSPYGIIRQLRDSQDEINKRRSKAIHLLNSRKIIAESDSLDLKENDWYKVKEEAGKPDGQILLKPGFGQSGKRFEIESGAALADAQYRFEEEAKGEISQIAGVPEEMLGQETNAKSGKAIIARQVQGTTMLGKLFDNYRRSRQLLGQMLFAFIQQFYSQSMTLRITDKQGGWEFQEINKLVSDGQQVFIQNDISKAKCDIVIDEQVYHSTIRQALMEQMTAMVGSLPPDIGLMLLDMVVSYSDLPQKDEMVQRIQQIQKMMMGQQQQQMAAQQQQQAMEQQRAVMEQQRGQVEALSKARGSSKAVGPPRPQNGGVKPQGPPQNTPGAIAGQMFGGA